MAGWQLVKCTSAYFVSRFWRGVGRSLIHRYNKNMYLRKIGSFRRTGDRQIR